MERKHAWEKAEELAGVAGRNNVSARNGMKAAMGTRHPYSGSDTFEVDGTDVLNKVDWLHQPGMRPDAPAPAPEYGRAIEPPSFAETLYFKQGRPKGGENLEHCIRDDQGLEPLVELAEWTRKVRNATISLEGSASEEGDQGYNRNLADSRAALVEHFMFRVGADTHHNAFTLAVLGEQDGCPRRNYRYVRIVISSTGTSRRQYHAPNTNLPSEVQP